MKASKDDQLALLELQENDLSISQVRHRLTTDPLRAKLEELSGRADDLRRSIIAQKADVMERSQKIIKMEGEVGQVEDRRRIQQERLDTGKIPLRDMKAVEHEIEKIVERKDQLEFDLLELQEDREKREAFLVQTEQAVTALLADEEATKVAMETSLLTPTAELEAGERKVEELRARIPAPLLEEYDYLRSRIGMPVVLRFEEGALRNAPVELTGSEVSALLKASEDQLFVSEQMGYLIVRV